MIELDVHNEDGEVTGSVGFDESVLGEKVRLRLLHQVAVAYMAARRRGTASAKTRAECAGSGKKPWRQKHSGRARAGSRRSPLWRGGGVVFGPVPRDYRQRIPRKMRRSALRSALLSKFLDRQVTVIEPFTGARAFDEPRTRRVSSMLKALGLAGSCVLAVRGHDPVLYKSSRNIPRLKVLEFRQLNALDLLEHDGLVLTRDALLGLAEAVGPIPDGAGGGAPR